MLRFFKVLVSFWFWKLSSIKDVMKNHLWIKCGIEKRSGDAIIIDITTLFFRALQLLLLLSFVVVFFYRWKNFLASMILVLRSFLHLVAKTMSFFSFILCCLGKDREISTNLIHSYASLVFIPPLCCVCYFS